MVFHLPNEQALRLRINYTQQFTLTLLWNVGILGIIVTGLFLIFFILKQYQLRVAANQAMRDSILTFEDRSSQIQILKRESGEGESLKEIIPTPKTMLFKAINLMTSICFYLFWIVGCFFYLTFFMFGYFGRGTHVDVLSVFVLTAGLILPTLLWKHKTKTVSWGKLKNEAIFTIVMLLLWLELSVFLVIATKGACVCYFNDQYGFPVSKDAKLSTEFTRKDVIGVPCPEKEVCHLYATVPQDASTAVFFNAHAGITVQSLSFTVKLNDAVIAMKNASRFLKMDNVQSIGQRNVYSIYFSGLAPNTTYKLQVSDKSGSILKWANYKTVPGPDASQIRMAIGGDLGMTKQGKQMTSYLKQFSPDIIILGGDTVYDDGMRTCYNSWDQFYNMFDQINQQLNRIVPIVMTVGNHDVGFDALTSNSISTAPEEYPLFFYYNPQHISDSNNVPALQSRKSYHYHKIGPTVHLSLDSGYINNHSSQTDFIRSTVQANPNLYLFANYHNPIYPACTNSNAGSPDRLVIDAGQQHWTPLFDQFGFIASMEHHTHYRKFTYPIKNKTVDLTSGTRYIGDGSWGVAQDVCPDEKHTPHPELMEKVAFEEANHMWQITLKLNDAQRRSYSINYTAVDLWGAVVTEHVQNLPALA